MKIKNQKDLDILDARIQNELGIDVRKYRDEEAIGAFFDLLIFPIYVLKWAIRPVIVFLLLFLIGFFVVDLVHVEYVIYTLLGLILFLLTSLFTSLLYVSSKIKTDVRGIIEYTLGILKGSLTDLNQIGNTIEPGNRKEVLVLLFQGITHFVTIPTISAVISNKIPYVGGFLKRFISRILTWVSNKVSFDDDDLEAQLAAEKDDPRIIEIYQAAINKTQFGLNKVLNVGFTIAQLPMLFMFGFSALILIAFLYLIW